MTRFQDIQDGSCFFDPECGEEFVKLNGHEARIITGPFAGFDDSVDTFNANDVVMTLEEAEESA